MTASHEAFSRRRLLQFTAVSGGLALGHGRHATESVTAEPDETLEWTFETGIEVESSPTVVDGTVYAGSSDHTVYAIDAEDGSAKWRFETGDSVRSSPTVSHGTVYIGTGDGIYASDAAGTVKTVTEIEAAGNSSPTIVDGTVYVGSGHGLLAIDAGVEGSSVDSRVEQGALGHHDTWASEASVDDDSDPASGSGILAALAGLGGAYYAMSLVRSEAPRSTRLVPLGPRRKPVSDRRRSRRVRLRYRSDRISGLASATIAHLEPGSRPNRTPFGTSLAT